MLALTEGGRLHRAERRLPRGPEDLRDRLADLALDLGVEVDERHPETPRQLAADDGLAGARACPPGRRSRRPLQVALEVPTCLGSESPPNFSSTAFASSNATTDSPTTPPAGTAQTSVRCLIATADFAGGEIHRGEGPRHGRERLHGGSEPDRLAGAHAALDAARARSADAMRPSRATISSCALEPGRDAVANPSPTSTPFTDWMLMRARARRASSFRS